MVCKSSEGSTFTKFSFMVEGDWENLKNIFENGFFILERRCGKFGKKGINLNRTVKSFFVWVNLKPKKISFIILNMKN